MEVSVSAKRRRRHRSLVAGRKRETRMRRQVQECRSIHWRHLIENVTVDKWRRPHDQDCVVAYVSCRCAIHSRLRRITLSSVAVISRNEVAPVQIVTGLMRDRLLGAYRALQVELVPRRARREVFRAPLRLPDEPSWR